MRGISTLHSACPMKSGMDFSKDALVYLYLDEEEEISKMHLSGSVAFLGEEMIKKIQKFGFKWQYKPTGYPEAENLLKDIKKLLFYHEKSRQISKMCISPFKSESVKISKHHDHLIFGIQSASLAINK